MGRASETAEAAADVAEVEHPAQSAEQLQERLPDPDPLLDFDLSTARLRDYVYVNRTLRYPYFQVLRKLSNQIAWIFADTDRQTMSHRPMHINDWIEIDKDYTTYLERKKQVMEQHGQYVSPITRCHFDIEARFACLRHVARVAFPANVTLTDPKSYLPRRPGRPPFSSRER